MSELKRCPVPWCKSTEPPKLLSVWGSHQFTVRCLSCKDILRWGDTEAEAIEAWNHRPFEAHAVEVLSQVIWNDYGYYRCTLEESKVKARELLGIKE